ncbi:MAG TPA: endonuclease domain-containing protein [Polyangiaceae bacterium]
MSHRYQPLSARHAATIAEHARAMRGAPSPSEQLLWSQLSGAKLGVSFKRQYIVGTFIADFAAPSRRLIVEVDGGYHEARRNADATRDAKLQRLGWRVLRISAELVIRELPQAVAVIRQALKAQ